MTAKENKFKYNGKEEITDLGVNWYDYGARMYMPDNGRWGVVDPLAELYRSSSPYIYVLNQPTQAIDPNGMACAGCDKKDTWQPSYVGEERPPDRHYYPPTENYVEDIAICPTCPSGAGYDPI